MQTGSFNTSDSLDTTFDTDGVVVTDFSGSTDTSYGLALQTDGKLLAAGGSSGDFALARYLSGTNEHTFHTYDANYNVTASIDRYGVILERYTYTPYGKRTVLDEDWSSDTDGVSDTKNNFGHQGGIIDGESFLMKFRHRDLHVSLGNWTERDPIGYADGSNLFQYVRENPVTRTDSSGLLTYHEFYIEENCQRQMLKHELVLDVPPQPDAYLIQEITKTKVGTNCFTNEVHIETEHYWEWLSPGAVDTWGEIVPPNSYGSVTVIGIAKYMVGVPNPGQQGFTMGQPGNLAPVSYTEPFGWWDVVDPQNPNSHVIDVGTKGRVFGWCCCRWADPIHIF